MNRSIVVLVYILILVFAFFLYVFDGGVFNIVSLRSTILIAVIVILIFTLYKEPLKGLKFNLFRPVVVFIIGYVIVHFQFYIDLLVGNLSELDAIFVDSSVICKSCNLSLIGLISFLLGYVAYLPHHKMNITNNKSLGKMPTKLLSIANLFLIILFISSAGLSYFRGGYGTGELSGSIAVYYSILIILLFFSVMILKSYNNETFFFSRKRFIDYVRLYDFWFYFSFLLYICVIFLSGDRGPAIVLLIAYVFNYFLLCKKKMNFVAFIFVIIIAGSFISLLGVARTYSSETASFSEKIDIALSEESENNSIIPFTAELAGSTRCLNHAVAFVPEQHAYLKGLFFFKNILSVIPFGSSIIHLFLDNSFKYRSSSSFITWIEQGDYPTSGAGTTCIADIYLDFGVLGVVLLMLFFGIVFKYVEVKMFCYSNASLWVYCLGFVLMAYAIVIPRSSFLLQFRSLVWLYLIIRLFLFIRKKNAI